MVAETREERASKRQRKMEMDFPDLERVVALTSESRCHSSKGRQLRDAPHKKALDAKHSNRMDAAIPVSLQDQGTPLHVAINEGRVENALELIKAGSDVNLRNRLNLTPLYLAVLGDHLEVVQAILASGLVEDLNASSAEGFTALSWAIRNDRPDIARALLAAGVDPSLCVEKNNWTALHEAANQGDPETVELLLEHAASVAEYDAL
eukprot:gene28447-35266_t